MAERANNGIIGIFSKTMECYSDVINDAVKGTEFEEKWDSVQDKLITIDNNIAHCMTDQSAKDSIE